MSVALSVYHPISYWLPSNHYSSSRYNTTSVDSILTLRRRKLDFLVNFFWPFQIQFGQSHGHSRCWKILLHFVIFSQFTCSCILPYPRHAAEKMPEFFAKTATRPGKKGSTKRNKNGLKKLVDGAQLMMPQHGNSAVKGGHKRQKWQKWQNAKLRLTNQEDRWMKKRSDWKISEKESTRLEILLA